LGWVPTHAYVTLDSQATGRRAPAGGRVSEYTRPMP
jgi:hypothetical protein